MVTVANNDGDYDVMEKSKKIKSQSDDILELVYQQLLSETSDSTTTEASTPTASPTPVPEKASEPKPAPPPSPAPAPSPVPKAIPTTEVSLNEDAFWEDRKEIAALGDLFLLYLLAKQCKKPAPTITASIEDTINIQQLLLQIENEIVSILKVISTNWEYIKSIDIEVDFDNNKITIKPKS